MNDLLGRSEVLPDDDLLRKDIEGKVVLVTGAGGSIGSELSRQVYNLNPAKLIILDSVNILSISLKMNWNQKIEILKFAQFLPMSLTEKD